jgi:hypothetical protein
MATYLEVLAYCSGTFTMEEGSAEELLELAKIEKRPSNVYVHSFSMMISHMARK